MKRYAAAIGIIAIVAVGCTVQPYLDCSLATGLDDLFLKANSGCATGFVAYLPQFEVPLPVGRNGRRNAHRRRQKASTSTSSTTSTSVVVDQDLIREMRQDLPVQAGGDNPTGSTMDGYGCVRLVGGGDPLARIVDSATTRHQGKRGRGQASRGENPRPRHSRRSVAHQGSNQNRHDLDRSADVGHSSAETHDPRR